MTVFVSYSPEEDTVRRWVTMVPTKPLFKRIRLTAVWHGFKDEDADDCMDEVLRIAYRDRSGEPRGFTSPPS